MDVSVIIPNYNYQHYLSECLTSVFESDLEPSRYEVLLIDDASTDFSVAIAKDFSFHLGRSIRIIRHEVNSGLVMTRNLGIREASGDFIFLLDSDNRVSPDCLRRHLEAMASSPDMDACYATIQDFISDTGEMTSTRAGAPFDFQRLKKGNYIDAMAMFRADVFRKHGGFDTRMPKKGWEDYEYWLRLGANGSRVEFLPGPPLSYYRRHDKSMTELETIHNVPILWSYLHDIYGIDPSCMQVFPP